ncbi:class I adenylate-forming enzyme family protein [Streptomyces mirabilis]|jgi:acyl-coenzyme A synthetase/AMP-(fatty) acid ligase|uniref:Acyl-CoA synthetase (AMP-forming)/AMP-acid ligase II n=1 Tax=Streptomyces mirabilis TaxID=68239 RepID=A0A1I2NJB3_9ACTN|nr:class I adenylate-forming enzyme family protein [Streptomyces mirabilis]SFG04065.1 Acyl-CoA synthetase (AMP-forming)/AMP-acid ligase II [Streptomyces mirabilis]
MAESTQFRSWLESRVTGSGNDDVWAVGETVVTRRQLRERVEYERAALQARSITEGSAVAVQMMPSFSMLSTLFALWSLGAQVQLLDPRLTRTETNRLIELCEPQFHVTSGDLGGVFSSFRDETPVEGIRLKSGRPAKSAHPLVQFSSGSTGLPKVIGRTDASLYEEIGRFARLSEMPRAGERVLLLSSIMHSFGLIGGVLHGLDVSAPLHFSSRPQARELVRMLAEREIAAVFGVPLHFSLLSRVPQVPELPALRLAVSGGELLDAKVYDEFKTGYGITIGQAYGMTETGIVATDLGGRYGPPAVGEVVPGLRTEVREGTLRVQLPECPYLYADRADRYEDGWLDTKDRCSVRPGSEALEITGRSDSLVAVGGLKVDLTEVEQILTEHPLIEEAVVVFGDSIEAHVVTSGELSRGDLLGWCRERLASYKLPRAFHYVARLPRTSNGKVVRNRELLHTAQGRLTKSAAQ